MKGGRSVDLRGVHVSATARLHALAGVMLQRQGVVMREAVLAEGVPGGFAGLYPVLRAMEEAGRIRRGYFVDGMGGSQFALPCAVDRLRGFREADAVVVALAATDPANPYGQLLSWPPSEGRPARTAGAYVVLESGRLELYLERGGRSLLTFGEAGEAHLAALAEVATRAGKVEIQRVDGVPTHESSLLPLLKAAGFKTTPRGVTLYA